MYVLNDFIGYFCEICFNMCVSIEWSCLYVAALSSNLIKGMCMWNGCRNVLKDEIMNFVVGSGECYMFLSVEFDVVK